MRNRILASSLVIGLIAAFAGGAGAQSRGDMSSDMKPEPGMKSESGTVGKFIDDATVTTRVKTRFARDDQVSAMNINVDTSDGVVQLSGYAGSEAEKTRAAEIASQVPDVKSVQNNIVVRGSGESGSGMGTGSGSTGGSGSYGTPSGSGGGTYR